MKRFTIKMTEFGEHIIADEDSVQALLITSTALKELHKIHIENGIGVATINHEWYLHSSFGEEEMAELVFQKGGMFWSENIQTIIDYSVRALHYEKGSMDGILRVKLMLWEAVQRIDLLFKVQTVYWNAFYLMYSNLLGNFENEMHPAYWLKKEKEEKEEEKSCIKI